MSLPGKTPTPIPNFFIIGAPKCGTTALSKYLSLHPNIFFSPVKEPHYFDFDSETYGRYDLKTYLSLYSGADPRIHQAIGEGSTGYLFSKVAVQEILKLNPDSKFIVMLRDPVELVQSWHSQLLFSGDEKILDFEAAWRAQQEGKISRSLFDALRPVHRRVYANIGKLGEQVDRLLSVVERSRVRFILFDDFASRTQQTYEEVLDFLGVTPDGRSEFPRVNENKIVRWPLLHQIVQPISSGIMWFKTKLHITGRMGFLQWLLKASTRRGKRPGIPVEFRAELTSYFQKDIKKLAQLINRDLSGWLS